MTKQIKIVDFYKNRDIFITGGMGYMGKVLIEKLLRSCSDLGKIFILVRDKKDKTIEDRLQDMLKCPLFELLRSQNPTIFSKLILIKGDITYSGLGISPEDLELIKNVSIVFHSAATTRFTEAIHKSVLINTYGTYQVMKLCEKLKYIKAVVHISTTFCNLDQDVLEEKIYPPYADWREIIDLAKRAEHKILEEKLVKKYSKYNHNSYTLTKQLGEQVVNDYKDKLPVIIFRPSIVFTIISEPLAGWTDALSGPLGLLVGFGTGIVRVHWLSEYGYIEFVAVDVAIKALIVAAYKQGLEQSKNEMSVYNCSKKVERNYIKNTSLELIKKHPFEKCIWKPSLTSTECKYYFMISFLFLHILPALFIDAILLIMGKKPFLFNLQKKVYKGFAAYKPFFMKSHNFRSENIYMLDRFVLPEEFDTFAFNHFHKEDIKSYYEISLKSIKKYMLNEPEESTPGSKIRAQIFYVLDIIVKFIFYFFLVRWIYKLNIVKYILDN